MKKLVRILFTPFINVATMIVVVMLSFFQLPIWLFLIACAVCGVGLGAVTTYLNRRYPDLSL